MSSLVLLLLCGLPESDTHTSFLHTVEVSLQWSEALRRMLQSYNGKLYVFGIQFVEQESWKVTN